MASSEYGGGVGGKFRTRPFRRALATPYDRPQTSARRTNPNPNPDLYLRKNGWLSRILDPASRVVAWSASRFFSSAFQKRLPDSQPQHPDVNLLHGHEEPEIVSNMQELSNAGGNGGDNVLQNHDADGIRQEGSSDTDGIFELEQLMKQNIFSKADSARLKDLLLSRTIELGTLQPVVDLVTKEEAITTESEKDKEQSTIDPSTSHQVFRCEVDGNATLIHQEDRKEPKSLHGHVDNPAANMHNSDEETASPEEIAKAYICSRPSKVSHGPSVRNQILQEDLSSPAVQHANRPSTALLAFRSSVHFSDSEKGYLTPRAHGRSALYKISRSPYFKAHPASNVRAASPLRDGFAGPSTSLRTMVSSGKQAKRPSSVLDSDFGSFGPFRRTRQKSDLTSPSKGYLSPPGNILHAHTSPSYQVSQGAGNTNCGTNVSPVPFLSTELARKIFQELDKLVPSPSDKLFEKKDVQGTGSLDTSRESLLSSLGSSSIPKQVRKNEEGPLNAVSVVKSRRQSVWMEDSVMPDIDVNPIRKISDAIISGSAAIPSTKEPVCETNATEGSRELNAGEYVMSTAWGQSTNAHDALSDTSLASSSKSTTAKSCDRSCNETGVNLRCPAAPASSSGPSAVSTILPLVDIHVLKNGVSASVSNLGSEGLSTATATDELTSLKFGASNTCAEGPLEGSYEGAKLKALPAPTSPGLFTFGAFNGPTGNDGSLSPSPSFATVSACPDASYSSNSSISGTSSSPAVVLTPVFPTIAKFQLGSGTSAGTSTGAPISVLSSYNKPEVMEGKSLKASPLTISSTITSGTINSFSNPSVTGTAQATSSIFSTPGGSSASAASCLHLNSASGFSPSLTSSSSLTNGTFGSSASKQFNGPSLLFAKNNSSSPFGQTGSQSANGTASLQHSSAVQSSSFSSSPTFGLTASSSLGSNNSLFSFATSVGKAVGFNSGFPSSSFAAGSSSSSVHSVAPIAGASLFSSSSQPSSSSSAMQSTFSSNSSLPSPGFSFGLSASTFSSNSSLPSPAFSFGLSASNTSGNLTSPFTTSSGPVFSFTAANTNIPVFTSPATLMPVANVGAGNDVMNVEDRMDDGSIQAAAAASAVPSFGQAAQLTPSLGFGTPVPAFGGPPVFQFGSTENATTPQSTAPSHLAGSFDFSSGGSFSLGSGGGGGGDKSGRRFIKVRRDKHKRK